MRTWLVIILVASGLSGCLSDAGETEPSNAQSLQEPKDEGTTEQAPASPNLPPSTETETDPEEPAGEPETPVEIHDSIGYFACAPLVHQPGWCAGFGMDIGGYWEGKLKGNSSAFSVTVEWTPATPASNELEVGLVCVEGPGCPEGGGIQARTAGSSPLTLEADGAWSNGSKMLVIVSSLNHTEPVGHYSQLRDGTYVDAEGAFRP